MARKAVSYATPPGGHDALVRRNRRLSGLIRRVKEDRTEHQNKFPSDKVGLAVFTRQLDAFIRERSEVLIALEKLTGVQRPGP